MLMQKGSHAPIDGTHIVVSWQTQPTGAAMDVSAYLLDEQRKVLGDQGMCFWGQCDVPGLRLTAQGTQASFAIDLDRLPPTIDSIAICAVVDNAEAPAARLSDAKTITLRMGELTFEIELSAMSEQALILGEIYRRNGIFKLRAVGQGFAGGLAALSTHYGVEIAEEHPDLDQRLSDAQTGGGPQAAAMPATPITLKKVTLAKSQKVRLQKNPGHIKALLSWEGRGRGDGDLDFYCFYVSNDGKCGKIYWKNLGSIGESPFIVHSGDSLRAGEECITIARPDALRYALFAAYSAVKNGAGSFRSYRPKMILTDASGNEVTLPLKNPSASSYWVAISHLDFTRDIQIKHIETYGKNGFPNMIAAERAPRLHPDGSWDVSKGEIEFKR